MLSKSPFTRAGLGLILAFLTVPAWAANAPAKAGPRDIEGVWVGVGSFEDPAGPPPWQNTSWPKRPGMTEWGKAESRRLADPKTITSCMPGGPIFAMTGTGVFPIQITASPGQLVMLFENYALPRRIYMDGRGHPDPLDPTWMGHSVGKWEGEVLVVDTVGTNGRFRPINGIGGGGVTGSPNDAAPRLPTSDQLHMVERIRLVGGGQYLEDEITINDPKVYTEKFSAKHYWQRRPDIDLLEYYCLDNPRPEDEGYQSTAADAKPALAQ